MPPKSAEYDRVTNAMLAIAGGGLVLMMLVVVADVVLRTVFNTPVRGTYDVVGIALLVMVMFGMAPVVARRGEILIDLIDSFLPSWALRLLSLVAAGLGVSLFIFSGWAMIGPAMDAWRYGDRSLELGVPQWSLWLVAFLGMTGIFWGYLIQLRTSSANTNHAPTEEGGL
ncbi:MAG: hypothetical protein VR78_05390 [Hoeflea sp. BRH_c9]|nr:MAG: hypothetical protein VR78_05390 [Hoeflea sp. BRH_c9]